MLIIFYVTDLFCYVFSHNYRKYWHAKIVIIYKLLFFRIASISHFNILKNDLGKFYNLPFSVPAVYATIANTLIGERVNIRPQFTAGNTCHFWHVCLG